MAKNKIEDIVKNWLNTVNDHATLMILATTEPCIKSAIAAAYTSGVSTDKAEGKQRKFFTGKLLEKGIERTNVREILLQNRLANLENFDINSDGSLRTAAHWVWTNKGKDWIKTNIFEKCAAAKVAAPKLSNITTTKDTENVDMDHKLTTPFDRRLDRLESDVYGNKGDEIGPKRYVPHSSDFAELSTTGYLISQKTLVEKNKENIAALNEMRDKIVQQYGKMRNDEFYKGVPALQNYYALVHLYDSKGGKYLVNQKNERRWYEIDSTGANAINYASTPTTSALISWGIDDPYGRTPYQFTDFVFSKYWNKIGNNRLITLRRYAAPILDNLKFPGMVSPPRAAAGGTTGNDNTSTEDLGSVQGESIPFPPMATAITYFGDETSNSLATILRFSTGVNWGEVQGGVWDVQTETVPSATSGPGGMFGGIGKFAEMLNVAGGNFDRSLAMNAGAMPPDPYENGPYENRIRGPINRIDKVAKREPGLKFEWSGLNLVFEYVARPVGGINPKAVLLDIMSNFLVMGSASAVFFGGAHRFMNNPAIHPFLGGGEGYEKWYKGDPMGWAVTTIKQFTQGGAEPTGGGSAESIASNALKMAQGFIQQLFTGEKGSGFGSLNSLLSSDISKNVFSLAAGKTGGSVPYLQGMKAILTGEPVGEWHVTIGNPLNPIAMIGNLICDGIDVEFNEELGPDDFPTEIKITVKLKHAMDRDRDAIESVFNRGMGRIYNLPDEMSGSADYQTTVDAPTRTRTNTGYMGNARMGIIMKEEQTGRAISSKALQGSKNALSGEISVWNRAAFNLGISENSLQETLPRHDDMFKATYRTADWIAQRSLQ